MSEFISVGEAASFKPGTGRTVHVRGRDLAVYHLEGEFFALDDQCPHRGGPLGAGVLDRGEVVCPLHGWGFDPRTGACRVRPDRPVRTYPTRVVDGQVEVQLSPEPPAGRSKRSIDMTDHPGESDAAHGSAMEDDAPSPPGRGRG